MPLINIAFITFTALLLVWCLFRLGNARAKYISSIGQTLAAFEEISSSKESPISSLSDEAQVLASQSCATHTSKNTKKVSFEGSTILLLRPADVMVPSFSSAAFKSVPAILTTIGILGTFSGITIGLGSLDGIGANSDQLVSKAMGLIEGLGTAFQTSIAGMGASFVFMAILSILIASQAKKREKVLRQIQNNSKLVSGSDLLHQLVEHQKESKNELADFSSLVDSLQSLVNKPSALTSEEYEQVSGQNAKALEQSISTLNKDLISVVSSIKQDEELLGKTLAQHIGAAFETGVTQPLREDLSNITNKLSGLDTLVDNHVTPEILENSLETKLTNPVVSAIDQVAQESQQINTAMFAMSEALDSLTRENNEPLTQAQLVDALQQELQQPLLHHLSVLQSSSTNIAQGVSNSNELLKAQLSEPQLRSALAEVVSTPIFTKLEEINSYSASTVAGIEDLSKSRMDEFEHLVEKMGEEVVKPVTNELSDTNKVVSRFADVTDELNQNVVNSVQEMSKATETVVNFEKQTLVKLGEFANSMDRSLNEFADNSTQALSAISEEVKGIVVLGNESIQQQTESFSTIIAESKSMFDEQANTLKNVGLESASLMMSARQELETGLGDIDNKVLNMSSTVQNELERFREDYQQNLSHYFTEQNRLLDESLNEQKSGLNEVVENFKSAFEDEYQKRRTLFLELDKQHEQLAEAAERVQSMAKAVGLEKANWTSEIQLVQQSIGRQVADLGKSFSEASTQFALVASQMRPEMDDYFKRANKSVEDYFASFDAASSGIYDKLGYVAELMSTVIEEAQQEKAKLKEERALVV
ncbi:hypothetical protein AB4342_12540 [Vibrio breoganii]|uniref:hypothetical protein n=1 Tax=Vibrio breoganii TaxID=553239 RepID=UPI000C860D31|nr:hypothetical protein [Vibrio breoganii]PMJ44284.1 hypothetical protein BCU21_16045 [Vibrio breoganii]PMK59407.1 hypothetical protein BCT97_06355 [Vibrio breoganii]PMM86752.1 hypothetical protein BCT45_05565 [Vibrio breoganii]PMO29206.1 hypothetical protein BCT14_06530 [Vibrio breoganii]PMO32958.1 hypothetical protein BCT13_08665 [Vibrio breoganii]